MRLLEIQNEADARQACAAVGREALDENLRGWAAIVPETAIAEGLRQAGLVVLHGRDSALAVGTIAQIWLAARSLADALERQPLRDAARDLMGRAAAVESPAPGTAWRLPRTRLPSGRTLIMGIVNATPDSFSDGGAYDPVGHGLKLAEQGADVIDVGGESTRPNAAPVEAAEERRRTERVVRELSRRTKVPISIDTTKALVAAAALDAGAEIVNVVCGLQCDPDLFRGASIGAHGIDTNQSMVQECRDHLALLDMIEAGEHVQAASFLHEHLDRARAAKRNFIAGRHQAA